MYFGFFPVSKNSIYEDKKTNKRFNPVKAFVKNAEEYMKMKNIDTNEEIDFTMTEFRNMKCVESKTGNLLYI